MRTLEHREVLSFLRGVLHALHVVQQVVQQPECAMAEAPG
jgi:hypothetical protein